MSSDQCELCVPPPPPPPPPPPLDPADQVFARLSTCMPIAFRSSRSLSAFSNCRDIFADYTRQRRVSTQSIRIRPERITSTNAATRCTVRTQLCLGVLGDNRLYGNTQFAYIAVANHHADLIFFHARSKFADESITTVVLTSCIDLAQRARG